MPMFNFQIKNNFNFTSIRTTRISFWRQCTQPQKFGYFLQYLSACITLTWYFLLNNVFQNMKSFLTSNGKNLLRKNNKMIWDKNMAKVILKLILILLIKIRCTTNEECPTLI